MKGGKWVWRIPPEMERYLTGDKDSQDQNERVLDLARRLRLLTTVGLWPGLDEAAGRELKARIGTQTYDQLESSYAGFKNPIYSEWLSLIIDAALKCDTYFCDDLAEAFRYIHHRKLLDPKGCLALAYLELSRPEGYLTTESSKQRAAAFLHWYDRPINTQTVQRYAEILYAALRAKPASQDSSQPELFKLAPSLSVNWSELHGQLGLTKEYLPRSKGGRPGKK